MQPVSSLEDRKHFDNQADLYSILITLDYLERIYIRDLITDDIYYSHCSKLLCQYQTLFNLIKCDEIPCIDVWISKYKVDCPFALERVTVGKPQNNPSLDNNSTNKVAKNVALIVALFITLMDKLRLNTRAMDDITPDLKDLVDAIKLYLKTSNTTFTFGSLDNWYQILSKMKAHDELDDLQMRQFLYDLETLYSDFNKSLHTS